MSCGAMSSISWWNTRSYRSISATTPSLSVITGRIGISSMLFTPCFQCTTRRSTFGRKFRFARPNNNYYYVVREEALLMLFVFWLQAFHWFSVVSVSDDLHRSSYAVHGGAGYFGKVEVWVHHGVVAIVYAASRRSFQLRSWLFRWHSVYTGT